MEPVAEQQSHETQQRIFTVCITGGIGSGKTTVANWFAEWGVPVIDSDLIAHKLTHAGGDAIDLIKASFGAKAISPEGHMDRDYMRKLVFSDEPARRQLESILHPLILNAMLRDSMEASAQLPSYLVWVIPLLTENKIWLGYIQRVLLVDCSVSTQIERVRQRNGLPVETIQSIIQAQSSRVKRIQLANDIVYNEGSRTEISACCQRLHKMYLQSAQIFKKLH